MRHYTSDANTDLPYPQVYLYCNRIENRLEAKFAEFSGRVFLTGCGKTTSADATWVFMELPSGI